MAAVEALDSRSSLVSTTTLPGGKTMATTSAQGIGGPVIDLAELIDRQGVTKFNILIIAIGWVAIFGDGFDIAVLRYGMPNLMREVHLRPETRGLVHSARLSADPGSAPTLRAR